MALADTVYQADFPLPELLEAGRDNVVKCPVYRSGVLAAPSTGTVSLYDDADTVIIDAQTVTITGDVALYTVTAANVPTTKLGEGWRIVWSLTLDSTVRVFDNETAVVRRRLSPAVTHAALYSRAPSLNPDADNVIHCRNEFQAELDAAWIIIEQRLLQAGRRPWLIVGPHSLREATLQLWMSLIWEGLQHRLNEAYADLAGEHRNRWEDEWSRVRLAYDSDDDGRPDSTTRTGVASTLWTC